MTVIYCDVDESYKFSKLTFIKVSALKRCEKFIFAHINVKRYIHFSFKREQKVTAIKASSYIVIRCALTHE